ncbi:MAG: hypothetical protein AAF645_03615 [Myxococcota bacterium]
MSVDAAENVDVGVDALLDQAADTVATDGSGEPDARDTSMDSAVELQQPSLTMAQLRDARILSDVRPTSGERFLVAMARLTNRSDSALRLGTNRFRIRTDDGFEREAEALDSSVLEGLCPVEELLAPGAAVTCSVVFSRPLALEPTALVFESENTAGQRQAAEAAVTLVEPCPQCGDTCIGDILFDVPPGFPLSANDDLCIRLSAPINLTAESETTFVETSLGLRCERTGCTCVSSAGFGGIEADVTVDLNTGELLATSEARGTTCRYSLLGNDTPPMDGGMPDSGVTDGGVPDMGPECTDFVGCSAARGCGGALDCIAPIEGTVGGTEDPIVGAPAGSEQFINVLFQDGMCTPQAITTAGSPGACDPSDPGDATCGTCGGCADLGGVVACFQRCTPNGIDNDVCRDGYRCDEDLGLCIFGSCTQDLDCQVSRAESNGLPGIQSPDDCVTSVGGSGDPRNCQDADGNDVGFDNLVFLASASCNTDTYECESQPFNGTASGGDACNDTTDCEENGFCISSVGRCEFTDAAGTTFDTNVDCTDDTRCEGVGTAGEDGFCRGNEWTGGSCTRTGCDLPGNACARDGVCQERGLGEALCLQGCTLGTGADPDDESTWTDATTGRSGCREGYGCFWNGVGRHGVANNGVCAPASFTSVPAPNIGAVCTSDSECWGPFGAARCVVLTNTDALSPTNPGYCTVNDCTAPYFRSAAGGVPAENLCGQSSISGGGEVDNICVNFGDAADPFGLCIAGCETPADCVGPGIACTPGLLGAGSPAICFPGCTENANCQDGFRCEGATPDTLGECVLE